MRIEIDIMIAQTDIILLVSQFISKQKDINRQTKDKAPEKISCFLFSASLNNNERVRHKFQQVLNRSNSENHSSLWFYLSLQYTWQSNIVL